MMNKYTTSGTSGNNQSDPPSPYKPAPTVHSGFKPNCDIHFIRAIFNALEKDFKQLLERKIRHWESLDARLGSQKVFDLPTDERGGEAGKLHRQATALKLEIDTMIALWRYLDDLTTFSLASWASLSDGWADHCRTLEQEIARLRAAYLLSLDNELRLVTMWCNSLTRKN